MLRTTVFAHSIPDIHTFFLKLLLLFYDTRSDVSQGGLALTMQLKVTIAGMLRSPLKDNYSLKISRVRIIYFDRTYPLLLPGNPLCLLTQQVLLVSRLCLSPNEFDEDCFYESGMEANLPVATPRKTMPLLPPATINSLWLPKEA